MDVTVPFGVECYFVAYLAYCVWARMDDVRRQRVVSALRGWGLDLALVTPAMLSWWAPAAVGPLLLWWVLFLLGCASVAIACMRGFVANFPDESLSRKHNIGLSLAGWLVVALATGPAIYWGGRWLIRATF